MASTTSSLVSEIVKKFGGNLALIKAVIRAEGNILKAVQCSIPSVKTEEEAVQVTTRSANNAAFRFILEKGLADEFVEHWAKRWAPVGATNDPTNLNANWPKNVKRFWKNG